jgi:hypothetical protein
MSRALWFAAGATAGIYALTKARRAAEALTPEGLADRLAGLSVGARLFGDEVRTGMAEKENDLREQVFRTLHGTSAPETRQVEGAPQHDALDRPHTDREGND